MKTEKTNWDKYFLDVCETISKNSKCYSRKIGVLLVRDNRILGTGYNGPANGAPPCSQRYIDDNYLCDKIVSIKGGTFYRNLRSKLDGIEQCPRQFLGMKSGKGLDLCVAGHAERNVLITAARYGIATDGATLYMSCNFPCKDCLIEIINAGIKQIVVSKGDGSTFPYYDNESEYILQHSNLKVRYFDIG